VAPDFVSSEIFSDRVAANRQVSLPLDAVEMMLSIDHAVAVACAVALEVLVAAEALAVGEGSVEAAEEFAAVEALAVE